MHRRTRRAAAGFTLIELMVVIVIIGLLATVVTLNVMPSQDRAMAEKAKADVSLLEQALARIMAKELGAGEVWLRHGGRNQPF